MRTALTRRPDGGWIAATSRPAHLALFLLGALGGTPSTALAEVTGPPSHAGDSRGPVAPARAKSLGTVTPDAKTDPPEPTRSSDAQSAEVPPLEAIGSLSVGHPHAGYLFNAVRMPSGEEWVVAAPDQAWGTEETVRALIHCIRRVHQQFPGSPRAIVGAISARHGGPLPPHKSHRTGRDADVYYYLKERGKDWYVRATADNLDRARTWALVRAVVTETDVEYLLIDRSVQVLLEEYALGIGEDAEWIGDLFHGDGRARRPLIKHIPGHTGHMHLRFFNPVAQERGRRAYDRLVAQGHIELVKRAITHIVEAGDTLSEIAERYHSDVEAIRAANQLEGTQILAGQRLTIQRPEDLRGARDPIVVPARRLPGGIGRHGAVATRALLLELDRTLNGKQ